MYADLKLVSVKEKSEIPRIRRSKSTMRTAVIQLFFWLKIHTVRRIRLGCIQTNTRP